MGYNVMVYCFNHMAAKNIHVHGEVLKIKDSYV